MDKKSDVSETLINNTANKLYEQFINVIPVAIGNEADTKEMKLTTKDDSNLIEAPKVFVPDKLGETIMRKVLKGMVLILFWLQLLDNVAQCLADVTGGVPAFAINP